MYQSFFQRLISILRQSSETKNIFNPNKIHKNFHVIENKLYQSLRV